MSLVLKSTAEVSLATTLPGHNTMIGPLGDMGGAGEKIKAGDACYISSIGRVLRSMEDQTGTSAAINDVQTMTFQGVDPANVTPQSGYVLGLDGSYTAALPISSNAAAVQTAMRALASVNGANMTVTGAFPNMVFTGIGTLAGKELDLIEVDASLIDTIDNTPANLSMVHTTIGQPAGNSGAEQAQSRVRGFAIIDTHRGGPITLYHSIIVGYSDGLLTPGIDLFLSATVPGGLDTAPTLTGQKPIAFTLDTQRVFFLPVN